MNEVPDAVEHTFREGNNIADFISNKVSGTNRVSYNFFQQLPKKAKASLKMDKYQIPISRIKNYKMEALIWTIGTCSNNNRSIKKQRSEERLQTYFSQQ